MTGNDEPYYVIAGVGFSAILNHVLLTKTDLGKKRIGDRPILHIGAGDPWAVYDIDRMGQWPALLHLPAFSEYHANEPANEFLRCQAFANANHLELSLLMLPERSRLLQARITEVEDRGTVFLVKATDRHGTKHEVRAEKIDVCTGLGPPRRFAQEKISSEDLRSEYLDEQIGGARRLLLGDAALHRETQLHGSICIFGGSTAAWCVERALLAAAVTDVLWVMQTLEGPFPVSGRNDNLLQGITRNQWRVESNQVAVPRSPRLRIACGYEVERLDLTGGKRVKAKFQVLLKASPFFVDSQGTHLGELGARDFDQVVLAMGYERRLPDFLGKIDAQWRPIIRPDGNKMASGIESLNCGFSDREDQVEARLRVLGPAARALERRRSESPAAREAHLASLPRQIDQSWLTVEALHIAWANGLFGRGVPNRNLNTADELDLERLGTDRTAAAKFLNERGAKVEPCVRSESEQASWGLVCKYPTL